MKHFLSRHQDLFVIIILVTIARGLMLLNDGLFWDDWTLYKVDDGFLFDHFLQAGSPLKGIMWVLFNDHPIVNRFITFFSFLASVILLYKILSTIKEITSLDRLILVLLYALFPLNNAMIAMSLTPHMVCHFLFYLGAYVLVRFIEDKRKKAYQLGALLCFFISFQIDSFLMFYAMPFCLIMYHEKIFQGFPQSLKRLRPYWSFIILPFFYWVVKQTLLKPYGYFEGYNEISFKNLSRYHQDVFDSFYNSFIIPLTTIFNNAESSALMYYFYYFGWIFIVLYLFFRNRPIQEHQKVSIFLLIGVLGYLAAVTPYLATRTVYGAFGVGWYSRYQIHISLSAAFILYYGLKWFLEEFSLSKKFLPFLVSIILAGFTLSNILNCFDFQRDWFKKLAIIEAIKYNEIVIDHTVFLIKDEATSFNVLGEGYRSSELIGLMNYAFNYDEKRIAMNYSENVDVDFHVNDFVKNPIMLNLRNFKPKTPVYLIEVNPQLDLSIKRTYSILLSRFFDKNKFVNKIKSFLDMKISPYSFKQLKRN